MDKFGSYQILEKECLILEYYSGEIRMCDIFHLKEIISKDKLYNATFNIIHDFRDAIFNITQDDIEMIKDFFDSHPEILNKRFGAYLTSKPNEVAFSTLFSVFFYSFPIKSKTFSTIESALIWLNKPDLSSRSVEKMLIELSTGTNRF